MIWLWGLDGTERLFLYVDFQIRYFGLKMRLWKRARRLEKELSIPQTSFIKFLEDYNNGK